MFVSMYLRRMRSSLLVNPSYDGIGLKVLVNNCKRSTSIEISSVCVLINLPVAFIKSPLSSNPNSFSPSVLSLALSLPIAGSLRNNCSVPVESLTTKKAILPNFLILSMRPTMQKFFSLNLSKLFVAATQVIVSASKISALENDGYGSTPRDFNSDNFLSRSSLYSFKLRICVFDWPSLFLLHRLHFCQLMPYQ